MLQTPLFFFSAVYAEDTMPSDSIYNTALQHVWARTNICMSKYHRWTDRLSPDHICEWHEEPNFLEFTCRNGQLVEFVIDKQPDIGTIQIEFFPHNVEIIMVVNCNQVYEFSTRVLPRSSIYIILFNNLLYGRPDLQTLPENIQMLGLQNNSLSGPIYLHELPSSLTQLNLENNKIQQKTVWFANLPIASIFLEGNKISELRVVPGARNDNYDKVFGVKKVVKR